VETNTTYIDPETNDTTAQKVLVAETNTTNSGSEPKPDTPMKIPLSQRVGEFIFDYYKPFIIISIILLLISTMIIIPSTIPFIILFFILAFPKGLIFAVIVQIFVGSIYNVGSYDDKPSWFKAICIGIIFSFTTLGGAAFGRYNWLSIGVIFLVVIPLMLFYDLEFKKTLPIIILSYIISIAYHAFIAAMVIKAFALG